MLFLRNANSFALMIPVLNSISIARRITSRRYAWRKILLLNDPQWRGMSPDHARVTIMKKVIALLLVFAVPGLVMARLMQSWSYQEMFDKADFVAIAKPVATRITTETNTLPNISPTLRVVGLATDFEVRTVMKGERTNKFVLHHYRLAKPDELMINGPSLVSFDGPQHHSFLLFLTRESDGRYAPVTGQTDPALFSVLKLDGIAR